MTWRKFGLDWVSEHLPGGGGPPDPTKFSQQKTVPTSTNSPYTTTPPTGPTQAPLPPSGGGSSRFSSSQQAQIQSAFSAAGIWDTIVGLGGDVWDVVSKILPKDAGGNVDWGKIGSDAIQWVKDNKDTILEGLSAYESYQRQQKSDQYAQQGLDLATKEYAGREPLRIAGQAGMLDPSAKAPDLSALKTQAAGTGQLRAPLPMSGGTNLPNIQTVAGAGSGNPFAKALPMAQAPQMPKPQTAGPLPLSPSPGFPTNTPPSSPPVDAQRPMVPPDKKTIQPLPIGTPGTGLTGPGAVPGVPPVIAPQGTAPGLMRPPGMKPPQGWALPLSAS